MGTGGVSGKEGGKNIFTSEEMMATSAEIVATKENIRYLNGKIVHFKDDLCL